MGRATLNFFGPAPLGPGEGSKGQISFFSITKSISKIFIPNFVCVLTNERYKTYQMGVLFCCLGHALGVGLGVLRGQNQIPSCYLSVMLSPPKPLDEIQPNWCLNYSHEWGVQGKNVFGTAPWGPWEGSKDQISFFQLQSQFQRFLHQTLCVYSQIQDTKHI